MSRDDGLPDGLQMFISGMPADMRAAASEYATELMEKNPSLAAEFQQLPVFFQMEILRHRALSMEDKLTGLGNRRAYELYSSEIFPLLPAGKAERRKSTIADVGMLMVDVNALGKTNNRLGHDAGDAVLVYAAQSIRESLHRGSDRGFRVGGDECVVVLPNVDGKLYDIAARVRASFCEKAHRERIEIPELDLAIGGALTDVYVEPAQLLSEADRAMYAQKASIRGRPYGAGA